MADNPEMIVTVTELSQDELDDLVRDAMLWRKYSGGRGNALTDAECDAIAKRVWPELEIYRARYREENCALVHAGFNEASTRAAFPVELAEALPDGRYGDWEGTHD